MSDGIDPSTAVYREQERIARDLHDTVIQRLFAVTCGLANLGGSFDQHERIQRAITELDQIITDIRSMIFDLDFSAEFALNGERRRTETGSTLPAGSV